MLNPELIKASCPQNSGHLEQAFLNDKLHLVNNVIRPLLLLYDRSKCSERNNNLCFADKKMISFCFLVHKKAQRETYEVEEQRFVSELWEKTWGNFWESSWFSPIENYYCSSSSLSMKLYASWLVAVCEPAKKFKIVGCENYKFLVSNIATGRQNIL